MTSIHTYDPTRRDLHVETIPPPEAIAARLHLGRDEYGAHIGPAVTPRCRATRAGPGRHARAEYADRRARVTATGTECRILSRSVPLRAGCPEPLPTRRA